MTNDLAAQLAAVTTERDDLQRRLSNLARMTGWPTTDFTPLTTMFNPHRPLHSKTLNTLARHDVRTLEQLAEWSAGDLLELRNFGRKSLALCSEALASRGMSLRSPNADDTP